MYDAPKRDEPREPLVFTQDELQQQLESGAFGMDKEEAIQFGLVSPYDDETDTILVKEKEKKNESGS
jgi:hypothetical protein